MLHVSPQDRPSEVNPLRHTTPFSFSSFYAYLFVYLLFIYIFNCIYNIYIFVYEMFT